MFYFCPKLINSHLCRQTCILHLIREVGSNFRNREDDKQPYSSVTPNRKISLAKHISIPSYKRLLWINKKLTIIWWGTFEYFIKQNADEMRKNFDWHAILIFHDMIWTAIWNTISNLFTDEKFSDLVFIIIFVLILTTSRFLKYSKCVQIVYQLKYLKLVFWKQLTIKICIYKAVFKLWEMCFTKGNV